MRLHLPIDDVLDELCGALQGRACAVVAGPPGSGKTTRVPPALLDAGLAGQGRVLMLEPRRVAARLAARRIASERGSPVGGEVGYRVRFEQRVGPDTRIEVLTEALLVRRLLSDPGLRGVGAVILDEVHERGLWLEAALALLRDLALFGGEHKLVLMSATLDPGPLQAFLGGPEHCAVVEARGQTWPVETIYLPPAAAGQWRRLPELVATTVRRALAETEDGHVLAFLPGVGEIRATGDLLGGLGLPVLPLHGRLRPEEQDLALAPSTGRKVVLATNIAESSVTLPGVAVVVDSGEARVPRFLPRWGMTRLERVPISRASSVQRAGRAGRTGPGRCYRLWTEDQQRQRPAFETPAIQREELAPVLLLLDAFGVGASALSWLEAPPAGTAASARELLAELGLIEASGALTELGEAVRALPVHPRLGLAVVAGQALGCLWEAAAVAAIAEGGDPWAGVPGIGGDVRERVGLLRRGGHSGAHRGRLHQLRQVHRQLLDLARDLPPELGRARWGRVVDPDEALARAVLAGFSDRVGLRREEGSRRYLLAGGSGATLGDGVALDQHEHIVALDLDLGRRGERAEARIRVGLPLERAWIQGEEDWVLRFDTERQGVVFEEVETLGALVLRRRPIHEEPDADEVRACLLEAALAAPERALAPSPEAEALRARLRFLAHHRPEEDWPLLEDWSELLEELCWGRRSFAELQRVDLAQTLRGRLRHDQRARLEELAPERLALPRGRSGRLSYGAPTEPPVLSARIQHLFGLTETPRLAGGRAPVVVHLLAPNGRPAQVTQDLAHFWGHTYAEVRKELRGRYPKHAWPEDPFEEEPRGRR